MQGQGVYYAKCGCFLCKCCSRWLTNVKSLLKLLWRVPIYGKPEPELLSTNQAVSARPLLLSTTTTTITTQSGHSRLSYSADSPSASSPNSSFDKCNRNRISQFLCRLWNDGVLGLFGAHCLVAAKLGQADARVCCWEFTVSLCHSNGHIETMPDREINPFTALARIRSQFLRTQWSTSNHQRVDTTTPQTDQPSGLAGSRRRG